MLVGTSFLDFEMSLRTYTDVIACLSQTSDVLTTNTMHATATANLPIPHTKHEWITLVAEALPAVCHLEQLQFQHWVQWCKMGSLLLELWHSCI